MSDTVTRGFAAARQAPQSPSGNPPIAVAALLGLAAWTLVFPAGTRAQPPSAPQVIDNAAMLAKTAAASQAGGSASDEIWISSEEPLPARSGAPENADAHSQPFSPPTTSRAPAPTESTRPGAAQTPNAIEGPRLASLTRRILEVRSSAFSGEAGQRSGDCLSASGLEQPAAPTAPSTREPLPPPIEESNEALFYTTSGPVTPANMLFRPATRWNGHDAPPVASEGQQTALRLGAQPGAESAPWMPALLQGGTPAVQSEGVVAQSAQRGPAQQPPPVGPESVLAVRQTPAGLAGRNSSFVILRMKVAELDRGSLKTLGLVDLDFSKRAGLARSLLKAAPGERGVLLDADNPDQLESQLQALSRRGVLRMRSQPTLVTVSGRPASLSPDGRGSSIDPASRGPASAAELQSQMTFLPVVTSDDQIQLEITSRPVSSEISAGAAHGSAPSAAAGTTSVVMRPGQTLAIAAHGQSASEDELPKRSLTSWIGIGKPRAKQPELVVFVTPELIQPGRPSRPEHGGIQQDVPPQPEQRTAEAGGPDDGSKSRLANPFTKLWSLANRKADHSQATGLR